MKKCAFLTLSEPGNFVIDDEWAVAPLSDLGWDVFIIPWRQQDLPWDSFDAVIIRSTWDYYADIDEFIKVLIRINQATRLGNPLSLVQWNLSKTYLKDLDGQGVGIVPTIWPGFLRGQELSALCKGLACEEVVVKPVIGANGEDTFRLRRSSDTARFTELGVLFNGRAVMVQKFMDAILVEGEYSLFFFNGVFSHAVRKVPHPNDFRSQEERGTEIIPVTPEPELLKAAQKALATIETPLYARIDMIRNEDGHFLVMEFELIEPSLYLRTDPQAPGRFAQAVNDWFNQEPRPAS